MNELLTSIYDSQAAASISFAQFAASFAVSIALGLMIAAAYMYGTRYTKSFVATLAMLPAIICVIIMMVNGSVGTGIAVAGAFSLVRFRSVPGTAKEICAIFLAMGTGLITGMGYLGLAAVFSAVLSLAIIVFNRVDLGSKKNADRYKSFRIMIPEDLDYSGMFDDLFAAKTPAKEPKPVEEFDFFSFQTEPAPEAAAEEPIPEAPPEEKPLVYEVTLEELMAMVD
jgi:hypothetical protein